MSNVIAIPSSSVRCTDEFARDAKLTFGDDYDMYVDWLGQLKTTGDVGITPVSKDEYSLL
jgi:hypothetical protein